MINYTFIIPHKNTPGLLNRCIESIPNRDDIEIIVVDDNSSEGNKPIASRSDVKIICLGAENCKGAGRARNYGIEEASGKWLLFPDADDYYLENFLNVLDKHKDSASDVIYFNVKESLQYEIRVKKYKRHLMSYDGSVQKGDVLKYISLNAPWAKMVKKALIDNYSIRFEEVMHGNDLFFTYQIGYFAKAIEVELQPVYYYYYNTNSLTNEKHNIAKDLISLQHFYQTAEFRRFIGHEEWVSSIFMKFMRLLKRNGLLHSIVVCWMFCKNRKMIISNKKMFVEKIIAQTSH